MKRFVVLGAVLWACLLGTQAAQAFCGFYVSGADAKLFNNATQVVLMREGTRTVLSMQNNYQGPPEAFAMVIPVPVVLQEENVKTLAPEIFDRVDKLAAPRLVEYWEQDPCAADDRMEEKARRSAAGGAPAPESESAADKGVKIEAQFTVGEYEIVILSASDSSGLDAWLRQNGYNIPEGAEEVLRPYVEQEMKFFVAKVNPEKVKFVDGMATLSPLRFHYDDDKFSLPIRLGMLNAKDKQDLIVHVLARNKRFEVANYKNVTIPTNLDVAEGAKEDFGAFYAALFDRTLDKNPGAVVTEYSWDASSCDPCPSPALDQSELITLGADVLTDVDDAATEKITIQNVSPSVVADAGEVVSGMKADLDACVKKATTEGLSGTVTISAEVGADGKVLSTKSLNQGNAPASLVTCLERRVSSGRFSKPNEGSVLDARVRITLQVGAPPAWTRFQGGFVLTRLHARYDKGSVGEDLVLREAPSITGGREVRRDGKLEWGATEGGVNNFQGRYAIRHPWKGPVSCRNPRRGIWGGPPQGETASAPKSALNLAFAKRGGIQLASLLQIDVPEIGVTSEAKPAEKKVKDEEEPEETKPKPKAPPPDEGCGCRLVGKAPDGEGIPLGLVSLGVAVFLVRRKRTT